MNATTILRLLTEGKQDEAILLLKQDIASSTTTNKNTYKARIKLAKQAAKDNCRPALAGAYNDIDNRKQVICNGYWLAVYNDIADGLIMADVRKGKYINYKQILPNINNKYRQIQIDLKKIATELKIHNAEKKQVYVKCDVACFNPNYLLDVLASFENPQIFIIDTTSPLYIKADNGDGIICPIRMENAGESIIIEA